MARTIDERIVQMTFNNQEFEERAKATISTLGKLKSATDSFTNGQWLNDIGKSIANSGLQSLTVTTSKISEGFNALEQIAIGALRNIGAQAEATGRKLIKELTIDNLATGWGKYVDLTGSVQTLVNSTGKGVEEIDGYLERLMWYSDETSFGFTDMTKALGTMVSSGGDINKLIPMLMGVGNATAYAGKGASEFSRVIYNLNQSYSSGALNTMDWKSIELAGVDSKMLKEQLMAAAVELGTINKEQAKLENFRTLLSDKVFTRDVMEKAFGRFADFTLEVEKAVAAGTYATASDAMEALAGNFEKFQEDAFTAAQSAKSFREAIEATKDAVSSGWMQSFKIIFGNYEESKALWTDVTASFYDWFAAGAKKRNDILREWKELWSEQMNIKKILDEQIDGRGPMLDMSGYDIRNIDDSLTQTQSLWKAFSKVVDNFRDYVSSIWEEVFPTPEIKEIAKTIFDFVERIRSGLNILSNAFGPNESKNVHNIGRALEGVLKLFRALIKIGGEFNKTFIQPLAERIKPIIEDIIAIFGNLGDIFSTISDDTIANLSPLQKILKGILDILDPIINGIAGIVKWIKDLTSQNSEISVFSGLFQTIGNVFEFIGKAVKGTTSLFSGIGKALGDVGANLKGVLGNFLESKGSDVSKLAEGGFLAYLAVGLTKVVRKLKKLNLEKVIEGIFNFFKGESKGLIGTIKKTFETLTNSIKTFTESVKVKMLEVISSSLLKLAAALLIISLVDADKIANSLGAMAGMLTEVVIALAAMNQINAGKGFNKTALAFDQIAGGLVVMAIALKIISSTQPDQMVKALGVLGIALLEVYIFMAGLNSLDPKVITNSAKAFKKISTGLLMMSVALKVLSSINPERMTSTLVLLGVSLAELFAFLVLTSNAIKDASGNKMVALGKALTNMGVGLIALSVALKIMSTINTEQMSQALMGLILSLGALGMFVAVMSNSVGAGGFIAIAAGMLILSTALIALGAALGIMGSLKLATIGKGLLALAGALVVIGGMGVVLGALSPLILLASVAIGAFGLALSSAAKGIIEFMAVYTLMQAMGPNFASALVDVFEQAVAAIIMVIPMFIAGIIDAVLQTADKIVQLAIKLLDILITAVTEGLPRIIELGMSIIFAILTGIRDNIAEFAVVALEIIGNLIIGLSEGLPILLDALLKFVISAINGLADAIRNNAGAFGSAVGNLASAIVTGIADALVSAIGSWGAGLVEGGKSLWDKIVGFFSGEEAKEGNVGAGYDTLTGVEEGIQQKEPELLTTVDTVGTHMTDEMDRKDDAKISANNTANGFINQISARLSDFIASGAEAGRAWLSGFASSGALDYASPSKATARAAEYVIEGFIGTIKDSTTDIMGSGTNLGSSFVDALSNSIRIAEDLLNDDLNPVITPVLDLSNIENNTGIISDLLSANASLNGAMNISGSALANLQNGVLSGGNTITMYNTFELNGVQDMDRAHARSLAEMLYDEMNTLLGNQV